MNHALSLGSRVPRSVVSAIMAAGNQSPQEMLSQLHTAFDDFKATHRREVSGYQIAIDDLNAKLAAIGAGGSVVGAGSRPDDPTYTGQFLDFVRGGQNEHELRAANRAGDRARINASMSVGSPGDGGFLAPTEWDRNIIAAQKAVSPFRRLADSVLTGVNAFSTLWDSEGWGAGWVGEVAARPATTTTTFAPLIFAAGEIYANPAVTQRLLDDADYPIEKYIATEVGKEFARQEAIAFISGDGVNKPAGLLTYAPGGLNEATHPGGALDAVTTAAAAAVTGDELIDFFYGLGAAYRQNSTWLISSTSIAKLSKLKDGQGNYLWLNGALAGQPATLLGRPVEVEENMPSMTAGNLPIALGDFKAGYLINDRIGIRVLRDPFTNKPFVHFYTTKRVGGGVRDPRAIRLMKMKAS